MLALPILAASKLPAAVAARRWVGRFVKWDNPSASTQRAPARDPETSVTWVRHTPSLRAAENFMNEPAAITRSDGAASFATGDRSAKSFLIHRKRPVMSLNNP